MSEFHNFAAVALGFEEVGPLGGQGDAGPSDEEEEDEPALVPKPWIGDFKHFYFF